MKVFHWILLFTNKTLNVYVMIYKYWRNTNNLIDAYILINTNIVVVASMDL